MVTIVAWLAVVVAVVALGFVWKLNSELGIATRRLDRYNKALFDANDEIRRLREEVEEEMAAVRVALRQQQGAPAFAPQMTVREALMVHPQAEQVLASFHLGGCSHCAVEPGQKLADACQEHGVDVQKLVGMLNLLAPGRQQGESNGLYHADAQHAGNGAPQFVKLPNVVLEFE
jgi:hybrid cluster-associated redox disulfide protein